MQQVARRIFVFCYQSNKVKALVDTRKVAGRPSLLTKIELAGTLLEGQTENFVKGATRLRITHVLPEGMAEAEGFGETLAANRGGKIHLTTCLLSQTKWSPCRIFRYASRRPLRTGDMQGSFLWVPDQCRLPFAEASIFHVGWREISRPHCGARRAFSRRSIRHPPVASWRQGSEETDHRRKCHSCGSRRIRQGML